ncbi:hypothetical protein H4R24_002329 [Coemansia sp. RSA 988]|nr:hypothetical protein H4R24_002329 [Coemansia sp. RSA 988]
MKRVRSRKVKYEKPRRAVTHRRDLYDKVLCDIDAFIRQREYGKASELLLSSVTHGAITVQQIWRPLIAVIQQQGTQTELGAFLDLIVSDTTSRPPYIAEMERTFHALFCGSEDAYTIAFTFVSDEGGKLAVAQGFLGIITACLREVELGQMYSESELQAADQHVFEHSGFARFVLTKHGDWQTTRFNLANAEYHLRQARTLDEEDDFFVPFHAQVLVALDRTKEAVEILEKCYKRDKSVHVLRMLEYLESDPYAVEQEFCNVIENIFTASTQSIEYLQRALEVIADRIERGDPEEFYKWMLFAMVITYLRQKDQQDIIESVMGLRVTWWNTTYFSQHNFQRTPLNERIVYMAVCAQQLVELEYGHPVYRILSGDLPENLAQFVNENIRIV